LLKIEIIVEVSSGGKSDMFNDKPVDLNIGLGYHALSGKNL